MTVNQYRGSTSLAIFFLRNHHGAVDRGSGRQYDGEFIAAQTCRRVGIAVDPVEFGGEAAEIVVRFAKFGSEFGQTRP